MSSLTEIARLPLALTIAIISCFVVKLRIGDGQASDEDEHKVKEQTCARNKLFIKERFLGRRADHRKGRKTQGLDDVVTMIDFPE